MNKKTVWQIIALVIVAAALVFGLPAALKNNSESVQPNTSDTTSQTSPQSSNITLTIEGLYSGKPVAITADQTVLQLLQSINETDAQLRLSIKEFSGLGTMVESLAGLTNGTGNEYWQYKVNGVMPQIGADQYKLKAGDAVEWYFAGYDATEGN